MKFGGTSVADETAAPHSLGAFPQLSSLVRHRSLVVSAMGRRGAPYATDTLLGLVAGLPAGARETDLLASVGELVSAVVVAAELRAAGIAAEAFSGPEAGVFTDGVAGNAAITEIYPADPCRRRRGLIPVVAGFQGLSEDGTLTTLGRGGRTPARARSESPWAPMRSRSTPTSTAS